MRRVFFLIQLMLVLVLCGCGTKNKLPDNPTIFEQIENPNGYVCLMTADKIYVPYCPLETQYLGDCIGYYDTPADEYTDATRNYVFTFKGYSPDEWIINTIGLNNCNEGMIMREINTVNIPDGISSEYEWNH